MERQWHLQEVYRYVSEMSRRCYWYMLRTTLASRALVRILLSRKISREYLAIHGSHIVYLPRLERQDRCQTPRKSLALESRFLEVLDLLLLEH